MELPRDVKKRFACVACKVAYKRVSDLRNHVTRSHLNLKLIECRLCSETFSYYSSRKQHMYTAHSVEKPGEFECNKCHRLFRRKNTLADHMIDVHIERDCVHCHLKFARKKYMFHMNEAHGVSMPTCGICGLRTLRESTLVRHQRNVHLKERNIACKLCTRSFCTQSNLRDHMITHNRERIYKCDECKKSFARRESYESHHRIHTGKKPFCCKVCNACFVQRASLRFHIQKRHEFKSAVSTSNPNI